jgi:hypothetical protein
VINKSGEEGEIQLHLDRCHGEERGGCHRGLRLLSLFFSGGMLIIDNFSHDNTLSILDSLIREGLPLFVKQDQSQEYD